MSLFFCVLEKNVIPTISQEINSFPVNCYVAPWLTFRRLYDYVMTEEEKEEDEISSSYTMFVMFVFYSFARTIMNCY